MDGYTKIISRLCEMLEEAEDKACASPDPGYVDGAAMEECRQLRERIRQLERDRANGVPYEEPVPVWMKVVKKHAQHVQA